MKRVLTFLIVVIIALVLAIVGIIIGKSSCMSSKPDPSPTADALMTTPDANTPTPVPVTEQPTPEFTPEPTPVPVGGGVDANGIAFAQTEGTRDEVFNRLDILKTLPEDATIILLDVGHGGFDPGSIGVDTEVRESDLNLEVSRLVAQRLGEKGYYVFMTRMGDYAVASSKNEDMSIRTQIMKLEIFDASISIHMNSFPQDRSVAGTRLYQYESGTEGERLAELIMLKVAAATGQKYRPTVSDNLMVVREPVAPAALVECGFISNHEEELALQNPEYQLTLAQAIAEGIEAFLNGEPGV